MQTTSSPTSARLSSGSSQNALIAWVGVAAVFVGLNFLGRSASEVDRNLIYKYVFAINALIELVVLVGVALLIARWLGRPFEAVGFKSFSWQWVGVALGVIVLVVVLGAALEPVLHAGEEQGLEPKRWDPDRADAFAVNALLATTLVPFAEETFFRGLGVRALLPFGGLGAVAVTALAFGLGHGILAALPVLAVFGAGLGWVRLRSGSVWPGMLAHGAYNGGILLFLYFDLT